MNQRIFNLVCGITITATWVFNLVVFLNGGIPSNATIVTGFVMGILFGLDRVIRGFK